MIQGSEKGFTLIEAVLIIIILGIIGVVVSLNLGSLDNIRVNNAIKKMVGDLRYAQQLAISTQSRHGITIDSSQQYSVREDCGVDNICGNTDDSATTGGGVDNNIKDPANLGQPFTVNFGTYQQGQLNGVQFSSTAPFCLGSPVIEFNSIGAPTDTNGIPFTCTSCIGFSGSSSIIRIQPNTGAIDVSPSCP